MEILLNKVYGRTDGKYIYAVILLNESDLAECSVRHYCADTEDEVADFLKEEEISEMNYVMSNCAIRKD